MELHPQPPEAQPEIRFVDFCAGLGGFHHALDELFDRTASGQLPRFTLVAAAELQRDLRQTYVVNFPSVAGTYAGLHPANRIAEARASRLWSDSLLEALPKYNADGLAEVHGDLSVFLDDSLSSLRRWSDGSQVLPQHDLLCAGFPCQPFSKSGAQKGFDDTNGTVFHLIATILSEVRPAFVILENVGNFERHDGGNTWRRVREILTDELGYVVHATTHVSSRSQSRGLLSPHHLGHPHHRERFFIVACRRERLASDSASVDTLRARALARAWPFPNNFRSADAPATVLREREAAAEGRLREIISAPKRDADRDALRASQLTADRVHAIRHWEKLLSKLLSFDRSGRKDHWRRSFPSFPIWGYELDPWNWYPADCHPTDWISSFTKLRSKRQKLIDAAGDELRARTDGRLDLTEYPPRGERSWRCGTMSNEVLDRFISELPKYVRERQDWPEWKQAFIRRNREFAIALWTAFAKQPNWLRGWLDELYCSVSAASNQKLEWNCKDTDLTLEGKILSFRPSGVRVRRLVHVPALVAISTTQVPVVPILNPNEPSNGAVPGVAWRHLLPSEALQLQGFPETWRLPPSRDRAFTCLGNAVHAQLVSSIFESWFGAETASVHTDDHGEQPSNVSQLRLMSLPESVACSA